MGVSTESGRGGKSVDIDINLVPFIDMMSCLVAFLLVTAVWTSLAQIPTRPRGLAQDAAEPATQAKLSLLLAGDAVWVGVSSGEAQRIPTTSGGHDWPALARALAELQAGRLAGRQDIEIAADDGTSYQTIVAAMDCAISRGFADVGYMDPASLSVQFRR